MKITIQTDEFSAETGNVNMAINMLKFISDEPAPITQPSASKTAEIPNDTYLTITADDITCGGKSVTEYNGQKISWRDDCMKYVRGANDLFKKEHNAELLELHVVQANNMFDNPMPDANGKFTWLRCVFKVNGERKLSRWVFRNAYGSVADCRSLCASSCGYDVRSNSAFRAGVFGSLGN